MKKKWMALLLLAMLLVLGAGMACAEETITTTIDLVFDGKTYTDTVQVDWTEKYPVPEGGVKWDGTEEFIKFDSYAVKDIREYNDALYVEGQIIFQAKNTSNFYEIEQIAAKYNAKIVGYIARTQNYAIELLNKDAITEEELIQTIGKLKKEQCIIASTVVPNIIILTEEFSYPNDPWNVNESNRPDWNTSLSRLTTDQENWNAIAIRANKAWKYREQMQSITIGVIDSSFPTGHRDINFVGIYGNNYDMYNTHAMHVSGIIAAIHHNGRGISGIFPNGSILGVGIEGGIQSNDLVIDMLLSTFFSHMCGIVKCINEDAVIINISQGTTELQYNIMQFTLGLFGSSIDYVYRAFFRELENQKKDFLLVCSAGNENGDTQKQQWYLDIESDYLRDRLVIVSGNSWENGSPVFINGFAWGDKVDILAPGDIVLSTTLNDFYASGRHVVGQEYYGMDGTSMAAPHVTGVAAMIKSIDPSMTGPEIKRILLKHGEKILDSHEYEHPVLDAYACVQDVLGIGTVYGRVVVDVDHGLQTQVEITQNGSHVVTLLTDEDGSFSTDLPIGQYKLKVKEEGYKLIEKEIKTKPGEDVALNLMLENENILQDKGHLICTVVDEYTSLPLDAAIEIIPLNTDGDDTIIKVPNIGEDGVFSADLATGSYELKISMEGYFRHLELLNIYSGETANIQIPLKWNNDGTLKELPGSYFTYEIVKDTYVKITGYIGPSDVDMVIPAMIANRPVEVIAGRAFYKRSDLTGRLVLPNTLKEIGYEAFAGGGTWMQLTGDLIIPNSVTQIGQCAFASGDFDGNLVLSENLTVIPEGAFAYCYELKGDLVIPKNVKIIEDMAFNACGMDRLIILGDLEKVSNYYPFNNVFNGGYKVLTIRGNVPYSVLVSIGSGSALPSSCVIEGYVGSDAEKYAKDTNRVFRPIEQ